MYSATGTHASASLDIHEIRTCTAVSKARGWKQADVPDLVIFELPGVSSMRKPCTAHKTTSQAKG